MLFYISERKSAPVSFAGLDLPVDDITPFYDDGDSHNDDDDRDSDEDKDDDIYINPPSAMQVEVGEDVVKGVVESMNVGEDDGNGDESKDQNEHQSNDISKSHDIGRKSRSKHKQKPSKSQNDIDYSPVDDFFDEQNEDAEVSTAKTTNKNFECPDCGKVLRSQRNLVTHMEKHLGKTLHECNVCGKEYSNKTGLWNHMQTHNEGYAYTCNHCGKQLKTNWDKTYHKKSICKTATFTTHIQKDKDPHTPSRTTRSNKTSPDSSRRSRTRGRPRGKPLSEESEVEDEVEVAAQDAKDEDYKEDLEEDLNEDDGSDEDYQETYDDEADEDYEAPVEPKRSRKPKRESRKTISKKDKTKPKGDQLEAEKTEKKPRKRRSKWDINPEEFEGIDETEANDGEPSFTFVQKEEMGVSEDGAHECPLCNLKFTERHHLQNHVLNHGSRTFQCSKCGKVLPSRRSLTTHMKKHEGKKLHECKICHKEYSLRSTLSQHMYTHRVGFAFSCEVCNKQLKTPWDVENHRKKHKLQAEHLTCSVCSMKFRNISALAKHWKIHAPKKAGQGNANKHLPAADDDPDKFNESLTDIENPLNDDGIVNEGFPQTSTQSGASNADSEDISHRRLSQDSFSGGETSDNFHNQSGQMDETSGFREPPNSGNYVNLDDQNSWNPNVGEKNVEGSSKSGEQQSNNTKESSKQLAEDLSGSSETALRQGDYFKCEICERLYSTHSALLRHKSKQHKKKAFFCPICNEGFVKRTSLSTHVKNHIEDNNHLCNQCGKVCNSEYALQRHMVSHSSVRDYMCDICGKGFKYQTSLDNHVRSHTAELLECSLCHKSYRGAKTLQYHMQNTHGEPGSYKCPVCGKVFKSKGILNGHIKIHDKASPIIPCQICGKVFDKPKNLKTHMRVHEGKKTHECPICHKEYRHSWGLKDHMFTHSDNNPYKCPICGKQLKNDSSLRHHKELHKENKRFRCSLCDKQFPTKPKPYKHRCPGKLTGTGPEYIIDTRVRTPAEPKERKKRSPEPRDLSMEPNYHGSQSNQSDPGNNMANHLSNQPQVNPNNHTNVTSTVSSNQQNTICANTNAVMAGAPYQPPYALTNLNATNNYPHFMPPPFAGPFISGQWN